MRRTLSRDHANARRRAAHIGLAFLRVIAGTTMASAHGWGKVTNLHKFTDVVANKGFPFPGLLAPAAAFSEFVGGILLALGFFTRSAALFVFATMTVAATVVHRADPFQKKELALLYAAVAAMLMLTGPGWFSIDRALHTRRGREGT